MRVRDIMRRSVVSLPQNATLREVVDHFLANRIDVLPVIDAAERAVGIIAIQHLMDYFLPGYESMLRDFSALEDKGQLASQFERSFIGLMDVSDRLILATDLMRSDLRFVEQDDSLLQAAALLQVQHWRQLPVVDRDQKLMGLVSHSDVALAVLAGGLPSTKAVPRRPSPSGRGNG